MHISSINVNNLSCITHQLNTIKCITKQYHEMAIEYLSFICFVGRLHLDHSALSSSSFMKSSFLIQMIRWIRGSSRIEFFIFLIAWGIFFEWWEIDLQLLPSSSSLLISQAESNHLLLAYILLLPLQVVLHSRSSHSSTVFSKPSSDLSSYLQIAWSRNQTSSVSLGKTLVV